MELQPFGNAGVLVTPLGLGLAALGRPGYINLGHAGDLDRNYDMAAMQDHAHAVLDAAWAAGVRYFDAARSYGRAEEFLGAWLRSRSIAPGEAFVASKWGYTYTAGWQIEAERHEVKEHTLPVLQRQWDETQQTLGDALRLYQIHSATFGSGVLQNRAVLAALARLKTNGTLIGLSLSGPNQGDVLRAALDVTVDGVRLFDAVQATWNLLEPSAGPALAEAADAGTAVVVKEALANGRLTPRNDTPDFKKKLSVLAAEADRFGVGIDALAIAAALAQPWSTVVLSGAATAGQLRANVAALDVQWDEAAARALASLAEPPSSYWQTRSNLPWN